MKSIYIFRYIGLKIGELIILVLLLLTGLNTLVVPESAASPLDTSSLPNSQVILRFEPHYYNESRGENTDSVPSVAQAFVHFGSNVESQTQWKLDVHWESETLGRRDQSLDLDRAWIRKGQFYFGRIHLWDVSENPEGSRPWGYLAQAQSQNRGILLGQGYQPDSVFPSPILLGWVGVHFWNTSPDTTSPPPVQWGLSATPFFLPSFGSEVILSDQDEPIYGRFSRRPPGFVQIGESQVALRYQVDRSQLFREIILQPQFMAHLHWRLGTTPSKRPRWQGWFSLSRAPVPDPVANPSGILRVNSNNVIAIAKVKPEFPQRIVASLSQRIGIDSLLWNTYALLNLQATGNSTWGGEIGLGSDFFEVSLLNEWIHSQKDSNLSLSQISYSSLLFQAEAKAPFRLSRQISATAIAGLKRHFQDQGFWIRSGLRFSLHRQARVELGTDLLSGSDTSYFGEWRSNTRVYLAFSWNFGGEFL